MYMLYVCGRMHLHMNMHMDMHMRVPMDIPMFVGFGPNNASIRPTLVQSGRILAETGQNRTNFDTTFRATKFGPEFKHWADFDRSGTDSDQFRPNSTDIDQIRLGVDKIWPEANQSRSELGQFRKNVSPPIDQNWAENSHISTEVGRIRPDSSRIRPGG